MPRRYLLPHLWHQPDGSPCYWIHHCPDCDLGRLHPFPTPTQLAEFYGDAYFTRYANRPRLQPTPNTSPGRSLTGLLDRLQIKLAYWLDRGKGLNDGWVEERAGTAPASICDVGCGNGDLLARLKALGHQVVGFEVDEHARRRAAEKGIEVHPGLAESLPVDQIGRTFDLVTFSHVLEHCSDPMLALRNAHRLIRPGGTLIVEVPNAGSIIADRLATSWFHADVGRHLFFYSARSLRLLVERSGFRFERLIYCAYSSQFRPERVRNEANLWRKIYGDGRDAPVPPNSRLRSWGTLARSAISSPQRKYELIGLIATGV